MKSPYFPPFLLPPQRPTSPRRRRSLSTSPRSRRTALPRPSRPIRPRSRRPSTSRRQRPTTSPQSSYTRCAHSSNCCWCCCCCWCVLVFITRYTVCYIFNHFLLFSIACLQGVAPPVHVYEKSSSSGGGSSYAPVARNDVVKPVGVVPIPSGKASASAPKVPAPAAKPADLAQERSDDLVTQNSWFFYGEVANVSFFFVRPRAPRLRSSGR